MKTKKCCSCNKIKTEDKFNKDISNKDGFCSWCKDCKNKYNKEYREKNRPNTKKNNEYAREWKKKHPEYFNKYFRKYRKNESERVKNNCRKRTKYSIKIGEIKKTPCVICGNSKSEIHHFSYGSKFDIIFVCKKHHLWIEGKI